MPSIEIPGIGRVGVEQIAGLAAGLLAIIGLIVGLTVGGKDGSSTGGAAATTVTVTPTPVTTTAAAQPTPSTTTSVPVGRPSATTTTEAKAPSIARDEARFRAEALAYFAPIESVPGPLLLIGAGNENGKSKSFDWEQDATAVDNTGGKAKTFAYTEDGTVRYDAYRIDKEFYANFNGNFFNLVKDSHFANQDYAIAFTQEGDYYYVTVATQERQRYLTPEQEKALARLALKAIF